MRKDNYLFRSQTLVSITIHDETTTITLFIASLSEQILCHDCEIWKIILLNGFIYKWRYLRRWIGNFLPFLSEI